jgi:hypothetical protein
MEGFGKYFVLRLMLMLMVVCGCRLSVEGCCTLLALVEVKRYILLEFSTFSEKRMRICQGV